MKTSIFLFFFILTINLSYAQTSYNIYDSAYKELYVILKNQKSKSFVKSVILVENAFYNTSINEQEVIKRVSILKDAALQWAKANPIKNYHYADSVNFIKNMAIYKLLKDTIKLKLSDNDIYHTLPYTYDFTDFFGHKDWSNMFVTKLLATHKGNCHSLPYLYKILADELGATCWLGFAPNHIYIKNRCQKTGWYNTELTSGDFPTDAWILTSGYIPVDAVRSGIYMDTLSNQQAIAQCVLDLAKGYEFQTKNYNDGFILKCCDLTLKYHPLNVQALLLKAETLKKIYEQHGNVVLEIGTLLFDEMEKLYTKLFELGYREMPDKMYMQWLSSIKKERNKYTNKQLKATLNKR
jgi:hypothetical protein